jgi:hypothetical protein
MRKPADLLAADKPMPRRKPDLSLAASGLVTFLRDEYPPVTAATLRRCLASVKRLNHLEASLTELDYLV